MGHHAGLDASTSLPTRRCKTNRYSFQELQSIVKNTSKEVDLLHLNADYCPSLPMTFRDSYG
eukprot:5201649-Amphidinium_carterae.1